jgi:hypothetical protein
MAYYAHRDFFEDEGLLAFVQKMMSGDLTLAWYDAGTEPARCRPADARRGLTYADCNVGSYGYDGIPEFVRGKNSMAARGSKLWGDLPDLGYTVNRKSEVWADNAGALYEEAKTRRWTPAVDIPWSALTERPRPAVLEVAWAQLCTFLEEMALVAMEAPGRWVCVMNQEFLEVKSLLCAQMIDEARHVEVVRKRALVGGEGLKRASVTAEQALGELLLADTYPRTSIAINVMLGSLRVGLCRHLAAVADNEADRRIFTLVLQDVARCVAYGAGQLRYLLRVQPHQGRAVLDYVLETEHTLIGLLASPELVEPLVILSGGGLAPGERARGAERVRAWARGTVEEYLARVEHAGLGGYRAESRLSRCLPDAGS